MARRCVWSRNLENEEAKARYRAVKIQLHWVVTPGKHMKQYILSFLSSKKVSFFEIQRKLNGEPAVADPSFL